MKNTQITKSSKKGENRDLTSIDALKELLITDVKERVNKEYQESRIEVINAINIGDMFYWKSSYRDMFIVDDLQQDKKYKQVKLIYRDWDWSIMAWSEEQESTVLDPNGICLPKLTKHPLEIIKEAQSALDTDNITRYELETSSQQEGPGTELLHVGSKESLEAVKRDLEKRKNHADIVASMMGIIIERKKQQLEKVKERLEKALLVFERQIKKIYRVITTIELYLGIQETIIQIQEGPLADINSPVCIRQGIMYMDEEVGDPWDDGQGLEWKDIADFDKWLTRNDNYKKVLPEQKGIAAFKCRREHKDRGNMNPYVIRMLEQQDNFTFLLMRNGDNLYRLITEKIEFNPRLFPKRNELQSLFELWKDADAIEKKNDGESSHIWSEDESKLNRKYKSIDIRVGRDTTEIKEKTEDHVFFYKMRFTLFQGIMERTSIFHPTPEPIKLFSAESQDKGLVRLIYDDELCLPSGKLPFWDWVKSINKQITYGSRIVLADSHSLSKIDKGDNERFDDRYREGRYSNVKNPEGGLYYVKKGIRYQNDPVWIDNPDYNSNLPETRSQTREHPEDKDWESEVRLRMNYTEQRRWFNKIVDKDTFDHHRTEDYNGEPYTDDKKHGDVKVKNNPKKLHKADVKIENIITENWEGGKQVESTKRKEKTFRYLYHDVAYDFMCIRYNPKDTVGEWNWYGLGEDPHERKNNISWKIYQDDGFILNYDLIDLSDLDFYLTSRVDRRHYIHMMPLLWQVRQTVAKELEEEKDFKQLVKGEVFKEIGEMVDDRVMDEAVENWKKNLKWKRAITHDDQKALRMIVRRLIKTIKL